MAWQKFLIRILRYLPWFQALIIRVSNQASISLRLFSAQSCFNLTAQVIDEYFCYTGFRTVQCLGYDVES
ncbi:MAG TPA: hypothetical protein DEX36_10465 [Glutamicibacter sp.]|nr:hypothetical protein [Glutamicibacter sp.]HCJ53831.1 hypothetical protein [Glutamicibacter sp.]HCM94327.1 hypothetical protein [Glutamicibacter sp.]